MNDSAQGPSVQSSHESGASEEALLNLAKEGWRLARTFARVLSRIDVQEQKRLAGQLNYFLKQLDDNLAAVGFRLVNLEGLPFDPGIAATPLNVADFLPEDKLVVDQMLEPLVMTIDGRIARLGTVMLRKLETQ